MVDVGQKPKTARSATARARVRMSPALRERLIRGDLPKGDAMAVVRIAAIMATKETPRLIPLCHPLPLVGVDVQVLALDLDGVEIRVTTRCTAETGVEMEAMTGAAIGALTLYDMVKGVERGVRVEDVCLLSKSGGRSGNHDAEDVR